MFVSRQKEIVVVEPNASRFDLIQEVLQAVPTPPRVWHFLGQHDFLQGLSSLRPNRTAFLLIAAEMAEQQAGLLLDQLSEMEAFRFIPIIISCSSSQHSSACLPDDPRINARIQLAAGRLSFQQKIINTIDFWLRVNITV